MFERYTEKARRMVFFGRYEASQFGSPYIETEHLLLGLLREDKALVNQLFRSVDVVQAIRKEIEAHTVVREKTQTSADLPLSNECKRVLAYAAEEAERLTHKHIGTEHLLLGLLREEKCFAAKLLRDRGVTLDKAREEAARIGAQPRAPVPSASRRTASITEFGTDVTAAAFNGSLPPLIGREYELQKIIQILCRRTRANPLLVGHPGVGKRAIVHGLAQRLVDSVVLSLDRMRILSVDFAVVASGTKSSARFEENLEVILRDLSRDQAGLILFIENLHTLAQTPRFLNLANVIKPALVSGNIQCISTATPAEHSRAIETAPWLEHEFSVVEIKPATESAALEVLKGIKERFEKFHGVVYNEEAIQYAVFHSSSYFPHRYLPEKAIDLIDEAGSCVKLRQHSLPAEVREEVQKQILLTMLLETAIKNQELQKAGQYEEELAKQRQNLEEMRKKYMPVEAVATVTREDIDQIVAERTGISIELLRKSKADEKPGS